MNSTKFLNLSSSEKKKVVKTAVRGANKDQKELVERYRRLEREEKK